MYTEIRCIKKNSKHSYSILRKKIDKHSPVNVTLCSLQLLDDEPFHFQNILLTETESDTSQSILGSNFEWLQDEGKMFFPPQFYVLLLSYLKIPEFLLSLINLFLYMPLLLSRFLSNKFLFILKSCHYFYFDWT